MALNVRIIVNYEFERFDKGTIAAYLEILSKNLCEENL
jgi:hypothetical protein